MREMPIALFPTAAGEGVTDGYLADMFRLDIRHVRASNAFTRDLLLSRAIELGFVARDWTTHAIDYQSWLIQLSHAVMGHWVKLLSPVEREEQLHALFVIRALKRKYHVQQAQRRS